jgi:hypothetical protein
MAINSIEGSSIIVCDCRNSVSLNLQGFIVLP